ncbi:MAG: cytochrome c [Bacteroidota bacterium]
MRWITIILLLTSMSIAGLMLGCQQEPYQQGKVLYSLHCENCHMANGTGLRGNIPPLAGADYLKREQAQISCIIRNGQAGEIIVNGVTYDEPMPGVAELSDFQIANIINYINHAWGNDYGFVKVEDIRQELENCK